MSETADIVVLGGGCAGLSLAVQLAERDLGDRRVLVLERRERYERDRTWCGWSVVPHPFQSCVDHAWSRWRVRAGGAEALHESSRFRYEHLRADRFYADALGRIECSSAVEVRLGVGVEGVEAEGGKHRIRTSASDLVATTVVDTRPPVGPAPDGALLQHFLGHEITTADPVFDPSVATLMDFDVPQDGVIHFVYVLPFSRTRALVESTIFSPHPLARGEYEERIASYVAERLRTSVETVHHTEHGVLPMYAAVGGRSTDHGVHRAGTAGGALKPSSGYGFHAIQRTTAALAEALCSGDPARTIRARTRLDGWLDDVFLSFLRRHPSRGPEVFLRMFRSLEPDVLVRFLMERPRISDRLRVIGSMPKLPFAREAIRVAVG